MNLRGRLNRATKRMGTDRAQPLTVVLLEPGTDSRPGSRRRTNAAGLPVVEIVTDFAAGAVELPPSPFKLVCGADPIDLV